jgi:thiamine pyrophosphokinase
MEGASGRRTILAAADSGLVLAEAAGFRPHWIIGDMDSLDPARLAPYPAEAVLPYPKDKDFTDTELAVSLLREQGCGEVWLIGGGGGRIDHLFAIRSLLERENPPARWITAAEDIRCLEAPETLHIPVPGTVNLSVFPLGAGPWQLESSGLKWPLAGLPWDRGFFGISNEALGRDCSIKAEQGRFMVILPLNVVMERLNQYYNNHKAVVDEDW